MRQRIEADRASANPNPALAPPPSPLAGAPTAPVVNPAADQAAAVIAGTKQRKKAALGALGIRPLPRPGALTARSKPSTPKALVGY